MYYAKHTMAEDPTCYAIHAFLTSRKRDNWVRDTGPRLTESTVQSIGSQAKEVERAQRIHTKRGLGIYDTRGWVEYVEEG